MKYHSVEVSSINVISNPFSATLNDTEFHFSALMDGTTATSPDFSTTPSAFLRRRQRIKELSSNSREYSV